MIGSVTGERVFSTADHIWLVKGKREDGKKYRYITNDAKL